MKTTRRLVALLIILGAMILLAGCVFAPGIAEGLGEFHALKSRAADASLVAAGPFGAEFEDFADDLPDLYDFDHNGLIEMDELYNRRGRSLLRYDADGDSVLTWEELVEAAIDQDLPPRSNSSESRWRLGPNMGLYRVLDLDGDDALTAEETPEILWASIVAADTNGDQRVSRKELDRADRRAAAEREAKYAVEDNSDS